MIFDVPASPSAARRASGDRSPPPGCHRFATGLRPSGNGVDGWFVCPTHHHPRSGRMTTINNGAVSQEAPTSETLTHEAVTHRLARARCSRPNPCSTNSARPTSTVPSDSVTRARRKSNDSRAMSSAGCWSPSPSPPRSCWRCSSWRTTHRRVYRSATPRITRTTARS